VSLGELIGLEALSGSFGACPRSVWTVQKELQLSAEGSPDKMLRFDGFRLFATSCTRIAEYLNVRPDECVFVQNATLGVNTVLRNLICSCVDEGLGFRGLDGNAKDCIVYFDTTYGAVEKTLFSIQEGYRFLHIRKVTNYTLPCTHQAIVSALVQAIDAAEHDGLRVGACVFDTITSVPAARFPFEELTRICRERAIFSVIDGAHGVGQIPLDLDALNPDFFVSNCHKYRLAHVEVRKCLP
jgi:selenocysteine lyase/cysteine desulfurase